MIKYSDKEFEIRIASSSISSLFNDDVEHQILSPLSCLREYGTYWLLEFDLPLVNKKDIGKMNKSQGPPDHTTTTDEGSSADFLRVEDVDLMNSASSLPF